jgi:transposase-like protein
MKRYSEEEKGMWLEDWRQSGSSLWAYAKENGLNPQTFSKWVKVEKNQSPQHFVEISPALKEASRYVPEILIEKGSVKIHIPIAINRNELRAVIESLGCAL